MAGLRRRELSLVQGPGCGTGQGRRAARRGSGLTNDKQPNPAGNRPSLYERVGEEWFTALVDRFYVFVESDAVLRPMYPQDLTGARQRLTAFIVQRWGGPPAYTVSRGHPRLRMRHFRFPIGVQERNTWVRHMTEAVRAGGLDPVDEVEVLRFFAGTATMVINRAKGTQA